MDRPAFHNDDDILRSLRIQNQTLAEFYGRRSGLSQTTERPQLVRCQALEKNRIITHFRIEKRFDPVNLEQVAKQTF